MAEDKWRTAITEIKKGEIRIRGYDVIKLMEKLSFSDAIFLTLKGELPKREDFTCAGISSGPSQVCL